MSLRCVMVIHPGYEDFPEVVCGKPARRRCCGGGCCDECFEAVATAPDFTRAEAEEMYPIAEPNGK